MQGLKQLQKQVEDLSRRLSTLVLKYGKYHLEIQRAKKEYNKLEQRTIKYETEINKTNITDHAIVRYLQRVYKLNLDDIKKEILPDELKTVTEEIKFGKFKREVAGIPFTILIRNNLVITVLDE
jgi:chromosome segregation ATPase